jgi:chemotaxis protein methyltransferase CheR
MAGPLLQSSAPARSLPEACGLPLASYRRDHVHACVVRALRREVVRDVAALVRLVDHDAEARTRLRRAIAASSTRLFRDADQLRWLDGHLLPTLTGGTKHLRVWSAGCSAGEEAFTLATMLEWHGVLWRADVVGTDILEEALAEGEAGLVGGAKIPASLRGHVDWDQRDLTADGPPSDDFDLVLCRGLLPILTPDAAERLTETVVASLSLGGVLVIGREDQLEGATRHGLAPIAPDAYRRFR